MKPCTILDNCDDRTVVSVDSDGDIRVVVYHDGSRRGEATALFDVEQSRALRKALKRAERAAAAA